MLGLMQCYKTAHWLYKNGYQRLARKFTSYNRIVYACVLPETVEIGEGTTLGYNGLGCVIHADTKIGRNCMIAQNVTIGKKYDAVPVIEDNVYIGAGSCILGGWLLRMDQ